MAQRYKIFSILVVCLGLTWVIVYAQSVSISVTAVNNAVTINAAAIAAGAISSNRAFDVSVTASANFVVDVRLDEIRVNGLPSTIPASALSLTANASGALGTANVVIDPFPAFAAIQSISNAFSGLAGASSEISEIDVELHLQPLGNRTQNDSISYSITFIITEQ
jgi:hypothetical protein